MKNEGNNMTDDNNTFVYSDPHFGHGNICKFTNYDGSKVRPWEDVTQMNEDMIRMYNETVPVNGKTYWLGDCVMNMKFLSVIERLNGDKILIKGNHDIGKLKDYLKYFRDVRAYHIVNGLIMSHIPIHVDCLARFGANVHGHLHANQIMKTEGRFGMNFWPFTKKVVDERYLCVCVEHTGFRPISMTEVKKRITDRGGVVGFRSGNGPQIT